MIGSIERPISVDGVRSEIDFLNNLVTVDGDYVLYHRLGSMLSGDRILDHYELLDCSGNRHELYIDAYGDAMAAVPPPGFLFERDWFGGGHIGFFERLGEADIDEEHVYKRKDGKKLRPIDRYIFESYGSSGKADFPRDIIAMMIEKEIIVLTHDEDMGNEAAIDKIMGYLKKENHDERNII